MTKTRKRFKQTTTLQDRLSKFTNDLRQQDKALEPNCQAALELRNKIRQSEAALKLNASLTGGK